MNKTISHGPKSGIFEVPSSKSQAHRMLITAALSKSAGKLIVNGIYILYFAFLYTLSEH
mgnify:CR=1 FL=1